MTAPWRLARLMDGYLTTQLLYVAARLGIADALAAGPLGAQELAEIVGAQPAALRRVLRGLVIEDVFAEEDGRYSLTELGQCLRTGPGSLRGPAIVRGSVYYPAATGFAEAVVDGGTPFERVYGQRFFEHLSGHPEHEADFHASMADRSDQEAADVLAAYDFTDIGWLVDVGGGSGVLLAAILAAAPRLRGTLLERPEAVAVAGARLAAAGLADRSECVAGDFFQAVPPGADAYLLSRIVHDWDDDDAARLLARCREAMTDRSRLLIVDAVLPEHARDQPAAIRMDLHMLLLLGARERTEAEFRTLLTQSGLAVTRVCPTASQAGLGVIEAVRVPG